MVSRIESKKPCYSTESEAGGSDGESEATEDARVDVLERIELCVSRVGGAPTHPDWLDTNCSLRHGVSMDEAHRLALRAIDVISRVIDRSKAERRASYLVALQGGDATSNSTLSNLALKLLVASSFTESLGSGSLNLMDMARICNVDPNVVQFLADNTAGLSSLSAMPSWYANSAQRVLGHFHVLFRNQLIDISELGLGEMRVGEEWEVGLAFALTSACTGFAQRRHCFTDDVFSSLITGNRWDRLATTALSCLVPASALIRFTAYGRGRNPHPLSALDACAEQYQFRKCYMPELLPCRTNLNANLKTVVQNAVRTLTLAQVHYEPPCELIAANIFTDPLAFLKLRCAASVRSALDTLATLVQACSVVSSEHESRISIVFQLLTRILVSGDQYKTDLTSGIVELFAQELHCSEECSVVLGGSDARLSDDGHGVGDLVSPLISILWDCPSVSNHPCRQLIMIELGNLAALEMRNTGKNGMTKYILCWLTDVPQERLRGILEKDVFIGGSDQVSASLCAVLASVLLSDRDGSKQGFESTMFRLLMDLVKDEKSLIVNSHTRSTKHSAILKVLFLYGSYCNELGSIASIFMGRIDENLESIEIFFSFLRDLHVCLHESSVVNVLRQGNTDALDGVPRSCSYALQQGFYEQHWYTCKTCGLVGEKGCCSVRRQLWKGLF